MFLTFLETEVDLERLNFSPLTFMKPDFAVMFLKCQPVSSQDFPSASNCLLYHRHYQVNGVSPPLGLPKVDTRDLSGNDSQSLHGALAPHSCMRVTVNYDICQEDRKVPVLPEAWKLHNQEGF